MLRTYQKDILKRLSTAWKSHRSVLVQMPTGTGKTHVLASVVKDYLSAHDGEVRIVAHRRELVSQTEETLARYGIILPGGRVSVVSVQWLARHLDEVQAEPELVVIDEAHHALAQTYRMMWEAWPGARFLGLTATPCRLSGQGFTDLFDVLVESWSIRRFVQEGWLSLFDYYSIRPDSEDQRLIDSLEKRGADGDYQPKELDAVLNRRPGIGRLYESLTGCAGGKKGIVYAINIDHARHIAAYYREHGLNAVAVDSKTPADIRKRYVEDFKAGHIRVLVSVDLFSEGFDCPDVEFIQLARPTLSMAKYLQMVGRGLRKSDGKRSCMLIDNVGLYRMFGLPVADRDWQAMFEGRLAGKGCRNGNRVVSDRTTVPDEEVHTTSGTGLEEIVSHETLLARLQDNRPFAEGDKAKGELRAFKDRQSGLYGLKRGETITVLPIYIKVFDIRDDWAAVQFADGNTGVVGEDGHIQVQLKHRAALRFMEDDLLAVTEKGNPGFYIDMRNGMKYTHRPTLVRFGSVEMLKTGKRYYCRTGHPFKYGFVRERCQFHNGGFYLAIRPCHDSEWFRVFEPLKKRELSPIICLLANDDTDWFLLHAQLEDGSIIITDRKGNYYQVENGQTKHYIGNGSSALGMVTFDTILTQLKQKAEIEGDRKQKEMRKERLAKLRDAEPFLSGTKWGLKLDGRVIVPPIYRSIRPAVGYYRAVEKNPQQWGVILLDGQVIVDMRYTGVEIKNNGTACLTILPGKTRIVKLNKIGKQQADGLE